MSELDSSAPRFLLSFRQDHGQGCRHLQVGRLQDLFPRWLPTCWRWAGASVPHHVGLSSSCLSVLAHSSQLPQTEPSERASLGQCNVFYDLVTHCHLSHNVFIRSKSLSPTHTQGEGVSLHLLEGDGYKMCAHILKPHSGQELAAWPKF